MESALSQIRRRPRFKIYTHFNTIEYEKILRQKLEENNEFFSGNINKEVASIWLKTNHNNYWKPYLSIRTEKEDNHTVIRGIFGPSAAVWTFFMFLYFIFSITFMVFITIWLVTKQINSNDFPLAIYFALSSLFLLLITYIATKIGQYKAKDEIYKLRNFTERSILSLED